MSSANPEAPLCRAGRALSVDAGLLSDEDLEAHEMVWFTPGPTACWGEPALNQSLFVINLPPKPCLPFPVTHVSEAPVGTANPDVRLFSNKCFSWACWAPGSEGDVVNRTGNCVPCPHGAHIPVGEADNR